MFLFISNVVLAGRDANSQGCFVAFGTAGGNHALCNVSDSLHALFQEIQQPGFKRPLGLYDIPHSGNRNWPYFSLIWFHRSCR